jgi:Arc/MetJ family transcription regulator
MWTSIEIDDQVLHEVQKLIGATTKREAVDTALRELVARHRRIGILDLRGRVHWEGDLHESRRAARDRRRYVGVIDVLNDRGSPQALRCIELIEGGDPIALTDVVFTEIPHGLRTEQEARLVERHLRAFPILHLDGRWQRSCIAVLVEPG